MSGGKIDIPSDSRLSSKMMRKWVALGLTVLLVGIYACKGAGSGVSGGESKVMRLTSNFTEIAIASHKVPGYWARETGFSDGFFLFTKQGFFKKGDLLRIEGPYGTAEAAVSDDETRVYQSARQTIIYVVWKAELYEPEKVSPTESRVPRQ